MFNGIIYNLARVSSVKKTSGGIRLALECPADYCQQAALGSSHAVQGVCLTVIDKTDDLVIFDVSNESLRVTSLGNVDQGGQVNIEPAMCMGGSIDGHLVSGHVDTVGKVSAIEKLGDNHKLTISFDNSLAQYIAVKGSICVDGVSLTVNEVGATEFSVNIIPYTWSHTCFQHYKIASMVNLEVDMLARYVARIVSIDKGWLWKL